MNFSKVYYKKTLNPFREKFIIPSSRQLEGRDLEKEGYTLKTMESADINISTFLNPFYDMKKDFSLLLPSLRSGLLTQAEFTSVVAA
ncbi:hypothetical protein CHS0354_035183, partial [Potamilus streckersoni]